MSPGRGSTWHVQGFRCPYYGGGSLSWVTDKGLDVFVRLRFTSAVFVFFHCVHVQGRPEVDKDPWLLSWSRGEMAERVLFASVPSEGTACCLSVPVVHDVSSLLTAGEEALRPPAGGRLAGHAGV